MILYNLRHAGDQYRITKLTNGEVASSYLCTATECQCPRGEYPTCRHRQMLPLMLQHEIVNTPWFLDWDGSKRVVDFEGNTISEIWLQSPVSEGPHSEPLPEPSRIADNWRETMRAAEVEVTEITGINRLPTPAPFRRRL